MKKYTVVLTNKEGVEMYSKNIFAFDDETAYAKGRQFAREVNGSDGTYGFVVVNAKGETI